MKLFGSVLNWSYRMENLFTYRFTIKVKMSCVMDRYGLVWIGMDRYGSVWIVFIGVVIQQGCI